MKELKLFIPFLLIILILLVGLGSLLSKTETTVSNERNAMMEMWRSVSWFSIPSKTAQHGEDAVIQWQDPGMEAHIRFLLGKPEGDIYKSEVWDIQVLSIQPNYHIAHDTMLTALPEGWTAFDYVSVTGSTRYWEYYEATTFPPLENLQDLIHFDSLQVLCINLKPEENTLTDLSGLEHRTNLKVLQLCNAAPDTLSPLRTLAGLQYLTLDSCGALDLQPLESLPELSAISLSGSNLTSLEPLTTLPSLSYLDLGSNAAYPTLEPLARSTVAYLNMGLAGPDNLPVESPDYASIAQIPGLVGLSLTDHPGVDVSLCREILTECENLQYLDIYGTPAAEQASELNAKHLTAFVYS